MSPQVRKITTKITQKIERKNTGRQQVKTKQGNLQNQKIKILRTYRKNEPRETKESLTESVNTRAQEDM